MEGSVHFVPLN